MNLPEQDSTFSPFFSTVEGRFTVVQVSLENTIIEHKAVKQKLFKLMTRTSDKELIEKYSELLDDLHFMQGNLEDIYELHTEMSKVLFMEG